MIAEGMIHVINVDVQRLIITPSVCPKHWSDANDLGILLTHMKILLLNRLGLERWSITAHSDVGDPNSA